MSNDFNATVVSNVMTGPDLFVLRIKPDAPRFDFEPGMYTTIGLHVSHPRAPHSVPDRVELEPGKLIRRAYSIASPPTDREAIELYVVAVPDGALSSRLMTLQPGERLWMAPKAVGRFTLAEIPLDHHLLLISTGTGLAPYMSMIRTAFTLDLERFFVVVHGVRNSHDLGYREELESLHPRDPRLVYIPLVSRPDPEWHGRFGRVQSLLEPGVMEQLMGRPLDVDYFDAFLCGNPEMVESVTALLVQRGFTADSPAAKGNVHKEEYW